MNDLFRRMVVQFGYEGREEDFKADLADIVDASLPPSGDEYRSPKNETAVPSPGLLSQLGQGLAQAQQANAQQSAFGSAMAAQQAQANQAYVSNAPAKKGAKPDEGK